MRSSSTRRCGSPTLADQRLQLRPHLVDRARRAQDAVLLAEALQPILVGIDAANALDDELELAVVEVGAALHLDELARVELVAEPLDVVEDSCR